MGESYYKEFLREQIEDLTEFLLRRGYEGLLEEFEIWLTREKNLK